MAMKGRFGRLLKSSVQALMAPADDPRATYADPIQQQRTLGGERPRLGPREEHLGEQDA